MTLTTTDSIAMALGRTDFLHTHTHTHRQASGSRAADRDARQIAIV